jgi:inhibitor of cysteine peptidase
VLDAQMKKIGALEDLAVGERIYSVRYRGKTAYVVTFRQVDPLFVIDLSDPKRPTVKGELKIPGFSEYLHPIDDNTLVGLGMNTTTTKYGGVVQDGMKLSLFDVSDPVAPRETASLLLGNMGSYSEAIDNHRAFLYYPQQRLIGLPAVIYTTSGATAGDPWSGERSVSFSGYLVIRVNKDGFEIAGTIPSEDEQQGFHRYDYNNAIERGLYIGKTLYTVSSARLRAFSLDTFAEIGELVYPS